MNLRTIATRAAVAGVSTALAAGALVGATTTSASAETGSSVYNCNHPLAGDLPIGVSATADIPLAALDAGQPVPGDLLGVPMTFTVPEAVVSKLKGFGVSKLGASSDDFAFRFSNVGIPLTNVQTAQVDLPATGDLNVGAAAVVGAFIVPKAGVHEIKMPAQFGLAALTDALGTVDLTCTIADETTAGILEMPVLKTALASFTAKAPKTVKKGEVAKVTAVAAGLNKVPTGTVAVLEGRKKVASAPLKKGKAVVSLKKLKPGKHTFTVSYAGDGYNKGATKKVSITVKK